MKHIFTIVTIMIIGALLALSQTTPVKATEKEAESAALLAAHFPTVDPRVEKLQNYLAAHNSPLTGETSHFINEADHWGIDWKLVAAIAGVESTFGKHIPTNSYNAWGWGVFTGATDGVHFENWHDGIVRVSAGLKTNYINRGAVTIEQIGRIYAASPNWSWKVRFFLDQIDTYQPTNPRQIDITI